MPLAHALLGLLAEGPRHGYDLKQGHDVRFSGSRPLAFGQVYATLARLQRDGLVEVAEVVQEGGPERTTYALTRAGRDALDAWLAETEQPGPYPADELVRKTVTALCLDADAAGFLRRQRAAHLDRMRELVRLRAGTRDTTIRVGLDHTVVHLDADLRWLEAAAEALDPNRSSPR